MKFIVLSDKKVGVCKFQKKTTIIIELFEENII